jgi:hypothetical protein
MGTNKHTQRKAKASVDEKLRLSTPSRDLLESLAVSCASKPSQDNTFQYAFALAKSDNTRELEYAVTILDGLIKEKYEYQIDCMYGAATALYRLKRYDEARVRRSSDVSVLIIGYINPLENLSSYQSCRSYIYIVNCCCDDDYYYYY